jgi:hypothetical protein
MLTSHPEHSRFGAIPPRLLGVPERRWEISSRPLEERELRDPGANVWHDHSDPNQPSCREGADGDPARVHVTLEGLLMRCDRILAVPVRIPGCRVPVPAPLFEFGPTLFVDEANTLGTVDRGDARQLYAR